MCQLQYQCLMIILCCEFSKNNCIFANQIKNRAIINTTKNFLTQSSQRMTQRTQKNNHNNHINQTNQSSDKIIKKNCIFANFKSLILNIN